MAGPVRARSPSNGSVENREAGAVRARGEFSNAPICCFCCLLLLLLLLTLASQLHQRGRGKGDHE
jgi:hypothetical protein